MTLQTYPPPFKLRTPNSTVRQPYSTNSLFSLRSLRLLLHRTQRIHSIPFEHDHSFNTQRFVLLHAYAKLLEYALATHLQTHFRRFPMNCHLRQQRTTQHTHSQQNIHSRQTKFSIADLSPIHIMCSVTSNFIPQNTHRFLRRRQNPHARLGIGWRTSTETQCITSRPRCVAVSPLSGEPTANPVRMFVSARPLVSYVVFVDRSPRNGCMNNCCYMDSSSTIECRVISEVHRMPASCRQPGFGIHETTSIFAAFQPHRQRISNLTWLYHITDISHDV
jgi:hypothetical protein